MKLISLKDLIIIIIFFLIGSISLFLMNRDKDSVAVIEHDGKVIYTIKLSKNDGEFSLPETGDIIYEIRGGKIRIKKSPCPEQTCVKRGYTSSNSIICLPQKIIITVIGSEEDFDAVVG